MKILTGTSGYSFKEWKGRFYPEDVKSTGFLSYYGKHFNTVELNSTFYRLPKAETFKTWAGQVPDNFTFIVKASRRITHYSRLKNTQASSVDYFFSMARHLGDKLGPTLFQCPPSFAKDVERLRTFLPSIPKEHPAVFEFRHNSWFDDEVYDVLREAGAAWCTAEDEEDDIETVPIVPTTDYGYFRLHREIYTDEQLAQWSARIQDAAAKHGWTTVYAFFNHEIDGYDTARRFAALP